MKNNTQNQNIPRVVEYRIANSSLANNNIHSLANHHLIPADICIPHRDSISADICIHETSHGDSISADICIPHRDSISADICIHETSHGDSISADICVPSPEDKTYLNSIFFSQSSRESFRSFPDKYPPSLPNSPYCSLFNYSPSPYSENSLTYSLEWPSLSSANFLNSQAPSVSTSSTHQSCVHIPSELALRDRAWDKHQNCVYIPSDITQKRDSLSFNDYTNKNITQKRDSLSFNDYTNSEIPSYNSSKKLPSPSPVIKDDIGDPRLVLLLLKPLKKNVFNRP